MIEETKTNAVAVVETKAGVASLGTNLELFQFSTPSPQSGSLLIIKKNVDDKGKDKNISMTLQKRSEVAKSLGVKSKDAKVTAELRKASDLMISMGINEIQSGFQAGLLTGGRFAKTAKGRITLSVVTPEKRTVSKEELEAAMATMSPDEQKALLESLTALAKASASKTVQLPADDTKPDGAPADAPKAAEKPEAPKAPAPAGNANKKGAK